MNKSLVTNLLAVGVIGAGYVSSVYSDHLLAVGLFATSGALTNWLAVHMLFEKVPGLYGSGVVPSRFEEFKTGIHALIMNQFFTAENVKKFLAEQKIPDEFDADPVIEAVDCDRIFSRLMEAVMSSPFGSVINMFGGTAALQPLRDPFVKKIRVEIRLLLSSPKFLDAIQRGLNTASYTEEMIDKVDAIVMQRLNELTPEMVKTIVQEMIHKHLGWLVVWGGAFGGFIGLIVSVVSG
ncbi:MAG: DUF445 domain-containing protein [Gemmatimonadetes bacterium]|nr:DUF445 domain-containing protein [Gemmatimonadota bacterium]